MYMKLPYVEQFHQARSSKDSAGQGGQKNNKDQLLPVAVPPHQQEADMAVQGPSQNHLSAVE